MFATSQGKNNSNMWLITKYKILETVFDNWYIKYYGNAESSDSDVASYYVRPTYYLKSNVKIMSGTGTELDPYIVGL